MADYVFCVYIFSLWNPGSRVILPKISVHGACLIGASRRVKCHLLVVKGLFCPSLIHTPGRYLCMSLIPLPVPSAPPSCSQRPVFRPLFVPGMDNALFGVTCLSIHRRHWHWVTFRSGTERLKYHPVHIDRKWEFSLHSFKALTVSGSQVSQF